MRNLFLDCETFMDSEDGYSMRNMSLTEYIRDSRFKLYGFAYAIDDGPVYWVSGRKAEVFLEMIDNDIWLICHNTKFDGSIIKWRYDVSPAVYFDTMSLSRAVIGQKSGSHSLKSVAKYLGIQDKGELKFDGVKTPSPEQESEMASYCIKDTEICREIFYKLSPSFPDSQIKALDWTIRGFIEPKLRLDTQLLQEMTENEKERRASIFDRLGIAKDVFASNSKFAALLQARSVAVPTKSSPRVAGKVIPALALGDQEFKALEQTCPDLYEARVAAKSTIVETRGAKLESISKTGPFPFDVQFSGAIGTHRYSGGSGAGGNPQNFPKKGDMRKAVCAPSGFKLVVGDFSSVEARLIAWLAKEESLIRQFVGGEDVYSSCASTVYGHAVDKLTYPKERQVGKTCILGLGYGMGVSKFQDRIKLDAGIELSDEEAKRIVYLYRETYESIPTLWHNASAILPLMASGGRGILPFAPFMQYEKEALILPSGLRIQYPNLRSEKIGKYTEWFYDVYKRKYKEPVKLYGGKLIENICQALAGEITKIAIERILDAGITVVGQVHDEILCVSPVGAVDKTTSGVREIMERSIPWWPDLKLAAEVKYGNNWKEAK